MERRSSIFKSQSNQDKIRTTERDGKQHEKMKEIFFISILDNQSE